MRYRQQRMATMKLHGLPGISEDLAELGPGTRIDRQMGGLATGDDLPYDVDLAVVLEDGRFVCESLTCQRKAGGEPVRTELVRTLPVVGLIRLLGVTNLRQLGSTESGQVTLSAYNWDRAREAVKDGPTDEALQAVAVAYRVAYACWWPPTSFVATQLELTRSKAARWVALARSKGHLGPTKERQAGGVS